MALFLETFKAARAERPLYEAARLEAWRALAKRMGWNGAGFNTIKHDRMLKGIETY